MKINILNTVGILFASVKKSAQMNAFANIAEGTHAGQITMTAAEQIISPNLLVKADSQGCVKIANAGEKPIAVTQDSAENGDILAVYLPGCASSTVLCVAASSIQNGDTVYGSVAGKVTSTPVAGAYKIGIALNDASPSCIVEVDPQGFGSRACEVISCGLYDWIGTTNTNSLTLDNLKETDAVIATLSSTTSSEKNVSAKINATQDGIDFTLDSAGGASTKVSWIILRKS